MLNKRFNALPGFGLTMGLTVFYLSVIVLIPMAALFLKTTQLSWSQFWEVTTTDRAMAAYRFIYLYGLLLSWLTRIFE